MTIVAKRSAQFPTVPVDRRRRTRCAAGRRDHHVDGKYTYNLDASGLGAGTYRVSIHINGKDVPQPGIFGLK